MTKTIRQAASSLGCNTAELSAHSLRAGGTTTYIAPVDGDLYTHLATSTGNGAMDERRTIDVMKQIVSGVDYLHRVLHIAHRELSLENVLMNKGQRPHDPIPWAVGI
ncbi:hypothetical protein PC120_g23703 [Phytophthora cactorum]|nr:hypothetical protein PC120_g23703 [Phytophthora cactorum]